MKNGRPPMKNKMREVEVGAFPAGRNVGLLVSSPPSGFNRGSDDTMILLDRETATALRDDLDVAIRAML